MPLEICYYLNLIIGCEVVCIASLASGIAPFLSFVEELESENQLNRLKLRNDQFTLEREGFIFLI